MYEEVRHGHRNVVRNEEMRKSEESTDNELRDLKCGKSPLDSLRNLNPNGRDGIVGVLRFF